MMSMPPRRSRTASATVAQPFAVVTSAATERRAIRKIMRCRPSRREDDRTLFTQSTCDRLPDALAGARDEGAQIT